MALLYEREQRAARGHGPRGPTRGRITERFICLPPPLPLSFHTPFVLLSAQFYPVTLAHSCPGDAHSLGGRKPPLAMSVALQGLPAPFLAEQPGSGGRSSFETQYSAEDSPFGGKPGYGDRLSPSSHLSVEHGISLLSLVEDAPTPFRQSGESVGWGGRPLQQQRRQEAYGYGQPAQRRGVPYRGPRQQPAPNQRPQRQDGRMKNQGTC